MNLNFSLRENPATIYQNENYYYDETKNGAYLK